MMIKRLLEEKNLSVYRLSKDSGVPYATLNDIVNGKAKLEKCSAETVFRIARVLNVSMEELLSYRLQKRSSFENFKSAICHRLKELGDEGFIIDTLQHDYIRDYYNRRWYPECFYLLAMLDYVSRENGISLCSDYDDIRSGRLENTVYPAGVLLFSLASGGDEGLKSARENAIPEFLNFNIVENEVRNVV